VWYDGCYNARVSNAKFFFFCMSCVNIFILIQTELCFCERYEKRIDRISVLTQ